MKKIWSDSKDIFLPGEEKVAFVIQPRDLQLYNIDEKWVVEPTLEIMMRHRRGYTFTRCFTVVENADKGKASKE